MNTAESKPKYEHMKPHHAIGLLLTLGLSYRFEDFTRKAKALKEKDDDKAMAVEIEKFFDGLQKDCEEYFKVKNETEAN